ncbi:uncharacterized protein LOC144662608 [Oculina patagonica]
MGDKVDRQPAGASSRITSGIRGIFSKAKNSAKNKTTITLKNLLLSAVVVGLEQLLSSKVFECPTNNHKAYGTVFLVAPFFIVFFTSLVILGGLSKLTERCFVGKYRRWSECTGLVLPNTIKALFGPFVWLITAFVDTTPYVCSEVGPAIKKRNLTNEAVIKALEQEFADAKSTSHMLAWLFFIILVIVTALEMFSKRCVLKDEELVEDPFILERREAYKAMETFCERTRHLYKQDRNASKGTRPSGSGEEPNPNPHAVTREDEAEDREDKEGKETDPFIPKYEETKIILYPDGAPELFGQKRVEKLFENWSKKDAWHYLKAYKEFAGMYPRIASGKPWKPWVSDCIVNDNVLKEDTSPP